MLIYHLQALGFWEFNPFATVTSEVTTILLTYFTWFNIILCNAYRSSNGNLWCQCSVLGFSRILRMSLYLVLHNSCHLAKKMCGNWMKRASFDWSIKKGRRLAPTGWCLHSLSTHIDKCTGSVAKQCVYIKCTLLLMVIASYTLHQCSQPQVLVYTILHY